MSGKYVPVRTCMVCRRRFPKTQLLRHVLPPEEAGTDGKARFALLADTAQIAPGRGWYVCADPNCLEKFKKIGRIRSKCKGVSRNG